MTNRLSDIKAFFRFVTPYLRRKNNPHLYRDLFLIGMNLGLYILLIYASIWATAGFSLTINALVTEGITFSSFMAMLVPSVQWIMVWCLSSSLIGVIKDTLANSFHQLIQTRVTDQWFSNNRFYFLKFIQPKINASITPSLGYQPAASLLSDSREVAVYSVTLFFSFFETLFSFVNSAFILSQLSGSITLNLFNHQINIPGYVVLASLCYAYLKSVIVKWLNQGLSQAMHVTHHIYTKLYHRLEKIDKEAESILQLKGQKHEHQWIREQYQLFAASLKAQQFKIIATNIVDIFNQNIMIILGFILVAPKIISKELTLNAGLDINYHMARIIQFFNWFGSNTTNLDQVKSATERLQRFEQDMQKTEKFVKEHQKNTLTFNPSGLAPTSNPSSNPTSSAVPFILSISDLHFQKPDGENIQSQLNAQFAPNQIYHLSGRSGIGKSTLLRILADIWPFVSKGQIQFNVESENIVFIPQNMYILPHSNLYEILLYPNKLSTEYQIQERDNKKIHPVRQPYIHELMESFKLTHLIPMMNNNTNHWDNILSGGEKQRIALISAILKKPTLLFMDEATSAMDRDNKINSEQLLKKHLPNTTIIFVDHNPSHEFADEQIRLQTKLSIQV